MSSRLGLLFTNSFPVIHRTLSEDFELIKSTLIRERLDLIISVFSRRILAIFIFPRGALIISTFPRIILDLIISIPGQASARQAAFSGGSDSQCLGVLGALSDRSRGVTNDLTSRDAAATSVCTRCCPTRWATGLGEPWGTSEVLRISGFGREGPHWGVELPGDEEPGN